MCQKNQACTGVESRNIIFIYGATIINERTLSKKKKNQACAGVESRNIISINVVTIISERTLRKKKKKGLYGN